MKSDLMVVLLDGFGSDTPEYIFAFIVLCLFLVPIIFYLLTLQDTFKEISFENQKMPPSHVWLILIPFFGLVWQFIVVIRLSESLREEFVKRKILFMDPRPGYEIGITYCALFAASIMPIIGIFTWIPGTVCWIVYWVRIHGYKKRLQYDLGKFNDTLTGP